MACEHSWINGCGTQPTALCSHEVSIPYIYIYWEIYIYTRNQAFPLPWFASRRPPLHGPVAASRLALFIPLPGRRCLTSSQPEPDVDVAVAARIRAAARRAHAPRVAVPRPAPGHPGRALPTDHGVRLRLRAVLGQFGLDNVVLGIA